MYRQIFTNMEFLHILQLMYTDLSDAFNEEYKSLILTTSILHFYICMFICTISYLNLIAVISEHFIHRQFENYK